MLQAYVNGQRKGTENTRVPYISDTNEKKVKRTKKLKQKEGTWKESMENRFTKPLKENAWAHKI